MAWRILVLRPEHDVALTLVERPRLKIERIEERASAASCPRGGLGRSKKTPSETLPAERRVDPEQVDEQPLPGRVPVKTADETA